MLDKVWFRWFIAGLIVGFLLAIQIPTLEGSLQAILALVVAIPAGIIGFFLDRNIPGRAPGEPILAPDATKIAYRKEYATRMKFSHKAKALIDSHELIPAQIVRGGSHTELAVGRLRISHGKNRTSIYAEFVIDEWDLVFESEEKAGWTGGTRQELIPKEGGGYEVREYTDSVADTEEILAYKPGSWEIEFASLFNLTEMKAAQLKLRLEQEKNQAEKKRFGL